MKLISIAENLGFKNFHLFENKLLNLFKSRKILFMNLELRNDSTLFNNDNKCTSL